MCFVGVETAAAMGFASAGSANFAIASTALSVAGLGAQALGTMQQTEAQNAQARYQSDVANNNAITAENEAAYATEQARRNAEATRRKTNVIIGQQRAAEGSTGAVVDSGSFMDVSLDTAERGEMDALALLREGDLASWRAKNQAVNYRAQAGLYDASQKSALMPVAGGLLSGSGQIGANWYNMTKTTK